MDTSETYIKMRLAARKDLLAGTPPEFNWDNPEWITDNVFVDVKGDFYYSNAAITCQLERQDQLQEMVGKEYPLSFMALVDFVLSYEDPDADKPAELCTDNEVLTKLTSREQLEMAFVMKEKYNKVWNGEDWI